MPANCTWCGHKPHGETCNGRITVGTGKTLTEKPCPCVRGKVDTHG